MKTCSSHCKNANGGDKPRRSFALVSNVFAPCLPAAREWCCVLADC